MGQGTSDHDERPGPAPEPFDVFYLREYPAVVGLLQGLLRSRLVAEELAQETFLRAYLRQQARERSSAVQREDDTVKLADEHAEVWEAVRTLPPARPR